MSAHFRIAFLRRRALVGLLFLAIGFFSCAPRAVALQGKAADEVSKGIQSGKRFFDHRRFDHVLKIHVRDMGSRFDYASLSMQPGELQAYLNSLAAVRLSDLGRDELLALLIDAYNAFTIQSVLETLTPAQPQGVASIREIPNVFARPTHKLGGHLLSLDDIEHGLIRPLFKDPRIHFVVNCASASCPPLPLEALTGGNLESQLEYAARRTLSSPDYVRFDGEKLQVTKLLDWYGDDFVTQGFHGAEKSLPLFIRKYASDDVAHAIDAAGGSPSVVFMDYDWSLNRAAKIRLQDNF
jgi:hypothetical protein